MVGAQEAKKPRPSGETDGRNHFQYVGWTKVHSRAPASWTLMFPMGSQCNPVNGRAVVVAVVAVVVVGHVLEDDEEESIVGCSASGLLMLALATNIGTVKGP